MTRKKFNKLLHKWLSIPLGIIIFILCITGAMLVFQQEILELSNPSHYFVDEVKDEVISLDELIPFVNEKLENNTVASVKISKDRERTYTMGLAEGFRTSVFVNQYTGEITGEYAVKDSSFFTIMRLHRWLLDSTRTWGKQIMGWSTILFIIILITGMCYVTKKRAKECFKLHLKKGTPRLIFDLHNALGWYAALVLIICSLSGLMWSFDWFRNSVFSILGAEDISEKSTRRVVKKEKEIINTTHWQTAFENVAKAEGKYDSYRISDGLVAAHLDNTHRGWVEDEFQFERNNGSISHYKPYADQDVRTKTWGWAYSLHVGDYWGMWSKVFTFFFCLVGASLPVTGYYFSVKKWKNRRKSLKKKV